MNVNDVITRHNFISKILFKSSDSELSKELRMKVLKMRMEMAKIRKSYEDDINAFGNELITDRFNELKDKVRSEEEQKELDGIISQINSDYADYVISRGSEDANVSDYYLTEDEFQQIMEVNSDTEAEINGQKYSPADLLEAIYILFIKNTLS